MRPRLTLNLSEIEQVKVSVSDLADDNQATINIKKNTAPNSLLKAGN